MRYSRAGEAHRRFNGDGSGVWAVLLLVGLIVWGAIEMLGVTP